MGLIKKIFIAVIVYLIFMLVLMPAKVVVSLAPLPSNVQITGVSGSLWQGQSELVTIGHRHLEQVKWQVAPIALFTGALAADLVIGTSASPVSGKAKLTLTTDGAQVDNLQFDAPHGFLIGNANLPFRTKTQGDISLVVNHGIQGQPWCEALTGKLFLNQTQVTNQFGRYPIGNMEFDLNCIDGQVKLMTDEAKNNLGLTGDIIFGDSNRLLVEAKIKPTAEQPEDLRKALSFLGKQDNQGYYPIRYNGVLPRF